MEIEANNFPHRTNVDIIMGVLIIPIPKYNFHPPECEVLLAGKAASSIDQKV